MKKILYICMAALAIATTSCSTKKDIAVDTYGGEGLEFVHFENATEAWVVTENDDSYDYDVVVAITRAPKQDVTYSVSLGENTTGEEGVDFSIPTKSVTIKAGEYLTKLPVKVLYDTTGEGFVLELVLSVDQSLINSAYGASSIIAVKSDKITIDWDWLTGNWNAKDSEGDPYVMAISKKDETTAVFTNIWGTGADIEGTVDFEGRTIPFQGPLPLGEAYGGTLYCTGVADDQTFQATMSPLGITISGLHYYLVGGDYDGHDFGEDYTNLTR